MKLSSLIGQAKRTMDRRGGSRGVKRDLHQLQTIAKGKGSVGDKAKRAASVLREQPSRRAARGTRRPTAGRRRARV